MAKKKSKGKFEFSKIGGILSNIAEKTGVEVEDTTNIKEKEFIGTGIYIFNALLSKSILKGGIQNNRITAIAGPSSCGKSFLCYNICREAQLDGYSIIYIDTEFSIELSDMESYGIDCSPEKLQLIRTNTVEDIKIMLTQLLAQLKDQKMDGYELDKFMIVMDSAGQLASRKEVEDAKDGKEKADLTRSKAIKSLFRIINADLGSLSIPMLITNHTYMCVSGETNIIMSDGTSRMIKDVEVGDFVKTLDGDRQVMDNYVYDNEPTMKIELEDGEIIECTENHKFLVKQDWTEDEEDECWKYAGDLKDGDIILKVELEDVNNGIYSLNIDV